MSVLKLSIFRRRSRASAAGAALLATCVTVAAYAGISETEPLADVRSAAEGLLRSELRDVSYGVHLSAQLDSRLHLLHCPSPLAAARAAGAELGAHVTVRVSCTAAGAPWAIYVPVSIESDVTVLVLRQSALRGARLTAAQVSAETRRVPGLAVGYVTEVAALDHRTLGRNLPAGTALTADAMLADLIVHQGQAVTLIAAAPGISVRAAGKVLEDGREGARVRVQNLASLKIVEGVVDASGVIEVTP
jgi:flagellar basal body P-ring formation protein FlgA